FYFATKFDLLLMFISSIVSIIHGSTMPLLLFIFGQLTNKFIQQTTDLCTLNLTEISSLYCPSTVELNRKNFYNNFKLCNLTALNITVPNLQKDIGQQALYITSKP
ncbi:unnamed protein product, partial [Didymodactylos carnosus]